MTRESLERMCVTNLAMLCKEHGIKHYHGKNRFTKSELVDVLDNYYSTLLLPGFELRPVTTKADYIKSVKVGTLVAFEDSTGKANTAAVVNISAERRQLKLVTQYDREYIVSFDNVLWVKTSKRWPTYILKMLKEKTNVRDVVKQTAK